MPSPTEKGLIILASSLMMGRAWCTRNNVKWENNPDVLFPMKEHEVLGLSVGLWTVIRVDGNLPLGVAMVANNLTLRDFDIRWVTP